MDPDTNPPGIRLDDGTWVDADERGRWHPSTGERVRAVVVLTVFFLILGALVLVAGSGDDTEEEVVATTTTTEPTTTTTTTTEPPDPTSVGGEAPPERCVEDDRDALPLRDRSEVTVLVLNGTPRNGHAGANTEELGELGYDTVTPDNASGRPAASIIHYRGGFCAEGQRMVADLGTPDAELSPVPRNLPVAVGRAEVVIILGRDTL